MSRAVEAGVYGYLVKPFREADLLPAIATARARHEELASLREEADSLAEALAARKAIERAKGILMARDGLSEDEAFKRLRKASQALRQAPQGRGRCLECDVRRARWNVARRRGAIGVPRQGARRSSIRYGRD